MLCHEAADVLLVHHHSVDYIFLSFGIIGLIQSQSEAKAGTRGRGQISTIILLHMNRLNKT